MSDGALTGATSQTVNCCPRQRKTAIQKQPRVMNPARKSQIPKPMPTSAIVIKAKICHPRLPNRIPHIVVLKRRSVDSVFFFGQL
jgi:hypothetical protein